jgi:hypothetical protein
MSLRILAFVTMTALVAAAVYLTHKPPNHIPQFEFNKEQPR